MASLSELSDGRAFLTLIAGGSVVLNPMNIPREKPLSVIRDTVEIQRLLWSGEKISYKGESYSISDAKLSSGKQHEIPIWIAPRGEKMCQLTGEIGDGAMLMVKADLGDAFSIINEGSHKRNRNLTRVFLDRIAYTPEMIENFTAFFPNVVIDTPVRQLLKCMPEDQLHEFQKALKERGTEAAKALVTMEMLNAYKIIGTPDECSQVFQNLVDMHNLDAFIVNIVSSGLKKNIEYLKDVRKIIQNSGRLAVE
jgi:alkanesulfonate monooxygenase SsuD/methylene tetrahydromethanopterin reductase-like flavin-dependent oxidoreductase (luciferase family)